MSPTPQRLATAALKEPTADSAGASALRPKAWAVAAIFAGMAALVFGSVGAINHRAQPLTYSAAAQDALATSLAAGGHAALADANIDWRSLRVQHIARLSPAPEVVLFGGSRWQEADASAAPGRRFYNAFVTNDFFEDIVALTTLLHSTGKLPQTLILSVRFFSVDYLERHDPLWWRLLSSDYRTMSAQLGIPAHSWSNSVAVGQMSRLLSAETAWTQLRKAPWNAPAWQPVATPQHDTLNVVGSDGALRFSAQHLRTLTPEVVEQDVLDTAAQHRQRRIRIDRPLVAQLGTLIGFLKQQGVQVVLVQTPFHPSYYRAIQGSPYHDDLLQIEADTRRIAAQAGARVIGGLDALAQGCRSTDFRDFNHASAACLRQVLVPVSQASQAVGAAPTPASGS